MVDLNIKAKMWLVLAILMISIVINNVASQAVARFNAQRLAAVSASLIPLSDLGKTCLWNFQKQISMYEDSVVFGDQGMIEQAGKIRQEVERLFNAILTDTYLSEQEKDNISEIYDDYVQYAIAAEYVYSMMISQNEQKSNEAQRLAPELNDDCSKLIKRMENMASHITDLLNNELAMVVGSTKKVNTALIFMSGIAIIFVLAINFFIVRFSILRPVYDIFDQLAKAKENREFENKLYKWHRLESLGALTSGVVGEMSEPLGGIRENLLVLNDYVNSVNDILNISEKLVNSEMEKRPELTGALRVKLERVEGIAKLKDINEVLVQCDELTDKVMQTIVDLRAFVCSGTEVPVSYNVVDGIKSVLQIMHNEIADKCVISENYEIVPDIICFPEEMNQVFMNLIRSSIDFVKDNGVIRVGVWEEAGVINVRIQDNGKGLSLEDRKHLFDLPDNARKLQGWRGLGLPVARDIIVNLGGKIEVESELGNGTIFTIRLPIVSRSGRDLERKV